MHNILDIVFIQFAVFVHVQLLEFLTQKLLVFGESGVQEAGDELGVVDLAAVVEVHGREYLLNVSFG